MQFKKLLRSITVKNNNYLTINLFYLTLKKIKLLNNKL
jgi:hypothetical protein